MRLPARPPDTLPIHRVSSWGVSSPYPQVYPGSDLPQVPTLTAVSIQPGTGVVWVGALFHPTQGTHAPSTPLHLFCLATNDPPTLLAQAATTS